MKRSVAFICLTLVVSLFLVWFSSPGLVEAKDIPIVQLWGKDCPKGVQKQPHGSFALYVFCDDALGTNISAFLSKLGGPRKGPYSLTKRFWQSESAEWGADVTSFAWLPDDKSLIVSTSAIYGSGKVYKLNLETQTSTVVYSPDRGSCSTELVTLSNSKALLKVTDCDRKSKEVEITI